MKQTWLPAGSSDPVSYTCTCPAAKSSDGLILLFYRYFSAPLSLPTTHQALANDPSQQATFHTALTQKLNLGGKIRVAKEGFNITIGGTKSSIEAYIQECCSHWSFSGLSLSTPQERDAFFKPTSGGCACAFGGSPASVRIAAEITPMGVTNYIPENWNEIESLSPAEFHERCYSDSQTLLLDVRNHYESRIGYFVHPKTGEAALRPPIRRFSQWPQYVKKYMTGSERESEREMERGGRQIMTYCTGGIRCEKGARWMQENMQKRKGDRVCTLKGGITAYLTWIDEEIRLGKKRPEDSLFRGKNYVFDARGSTGLNGDTLLDPVSICHVCGKLEDRLSKCQSKGCHLILVVCEVCEAADPRCCQSCRDIDESAASDLDLKVSRLICDCEREREILLWGLDRTKKSIQQRNKNEIVDHIDVRVKII
jgi:predicted sulfurtransferase